MKIVIDLQAAQGFHRERGMGRYSLAVAQEMARLALGQGRDHEIWIALNGAFPETIDPLRAAFEGLVPRERIVTWLAPRGLSEFEPQTGSRWRREAAERIREAFLASLRPDAVLVSNLFEGAVAGDAVTSVGVLERPGYLTGVIFYDLIPFIHPRLYLTDPVTEAWYLRNLASLCRADLFLAISESSRREGIELLSIPPDRIVNIAGAADPAVFRPLPLAPEEEAALRARHKLPRPFVMYNGNHDPRKNMLGLVAAYAKLPQATRAAHQLAIVCSLNPQSMAQLFDFARKQGLGPDEVICTGYVSEADLVALYGLCAAYVFPSWHEGFGLPALEAMACGAPVIAGNLTSLPEVVGREDALFDPHDPGAIAAKMGRVLNDAAFRQSLREHGLRQVKNFSWQATALRALEAFEALHARTLAQADAPATQRQPGIPAPRPLLAFVTPLPPHPGEAAAHAAALLPQLALHYEVEVVTDQAEVGDPWVAAQCAVRTPEWFDRNAERYDRIVYNFGDDAPAQAYMPALLARHPGTVVLHDFFLGGLLKESVPALYASHGYRALLEKGGAFPANLAVLQDADGIIGSSPLGRSQAETWYGFGAAGDWDVIPLARAPVASQTGAASRAAAGLKEGDFLVCAFGPVGPERLSERLLAAWMGSALAADPGCHLMLFGEIADPAYRNRLFEPWARNPAMKRIHQAQGAPVELRKIYLAAADAAVQLGAGSFGDVLDCLNHGLPTVTDLETELAADALIRLGADFKVEELGAALEKLRRDPARRRQLKEGGVAAIRSGHDPRRIAGEYHRAIERFAATGRRASVARLRRSIAALPQPPEDPRQWGAVAQAVAANHPSPRRQKQLLIDITELARSDFKSGIQRVVRGLLDGFLRQPPAGYRAEPIYLAEDGSYRYARRYTLQFLGLPEGGGGLADDVIEIRPGDFFLALDLALNHTPHLTDLCLRLQRQGAWICFVVYDLLPLRGNGWMPPQAGERFLEWARLFSQIADGILCISKSVAYEVAQWLNQNRPSRRQPLQIDWFHLGADVAASRRAEGVLPGFDETLAAIRSRPAVLMVGTVEPRKGYLQAVAAFEQLWAKGVEVNLVIVGKRGWMLDAFWEELARHPETGRRLFWLQNATDAMLPRLYEAASGMLLASEAEGFGLPLVEAARHRLPILARDIPVFREIAGAHAAYFSGTAPVELAAALEAWLEALRTGAAPRSDAMPVLTWEGSCQQAVGALFGGGRHLRWPSARR